MQIFPVFPGPVTYFREGVLKRKVDSLAGDLGAHPPDADDNMAVTQPQITIILLLS